MDKPAYLLDTNICIHIRRERPREVLARFQSLQPGAAAMSAITYGELAYGAHKSDQPDHALAVLRQLATLLPVLALDEGAALAYGAIRRELSRRGEIIGNNDLWIAAHALSLGVTLVTNNTREFERIDGLAVEDWVSASP